MIEEGGTGVWGGMQDWSAEDSVTHAKEHKWQVERQKDAMRNKVV